MADSILNTVKTQLGFAEDYTAFDEEIVIHINSAIMNLDQIGVCKTSGFHIRGPVEIWDDLLTDQYEFSAAKSYIFLQLKMIFDPPANSFVLDALKKQSEEIAWRLSVQADKLLHPLTTTGGTTVV